LRTLPGETSTVVFLDATGTPWPLVAVPRVSRADVAAAEWLEGSPSVVVSLLSPYEEANLTVFLSGLATPVVVKLTAGEPDSKSQTREVDYRLDLRVPGRSPYAKAPVAGTAKIALYDDTMQSFLDGIPPRDAVKLKPRGEVPARTSIWQYAGALFVRTSLDIQTAFDNTLAASDGTRVYRLPPTPFVTLSDAGRSVTFQVDIK
jgi:intracellular multiplication protein IcmK